MLDALTGSLLIAGIMGGIAGFWAIHLERKAKRESARPRD
jgi:hypothetical protein